MCQYWISLANGASIFKRAVDPVMKEDMPAELKVSCAFLFQFNHAIFVSMSLLNLWRFLVTLLGHIL